jgi:hypothetical protein
VTRHGIVRSLPLLGLRSDSDIERGLGREDDRRRKSGHGGRGYPGCRHAPRLPRGRGRGPSGHRSPGESGVPTTANGYEKLLRRAQDLGPVGCAGVEATGRATEPDSPAT